MNATHEATRSLYKVNFTYAAPNGTLRTGAYIIEETDSGKAREAAETKLKDSGFSHARITTIKSY